ncbi:MAG: hypothetical protein JXJ22_00215 [Bacteroidales bacterium]|nr:hypothetical protein [Bacteroidales bacterium]
MANRIFYSKILLFGEYSILCNSQALTIPFKNYSASLKFPNLKIADKSAASSNRILKKYADFLSENVRVQLEEAGFEFSAFDKDLENGLFMESTIPHNYGLGSSGALVAAVFDRYSGVNNNINLDDQNLAALKKLFSKMESWFHGKSSGIDPLSCYLQIPLWILTDNRISIPDAGKIKNVSGNWFLIDTKRKGATGPLVQHFYQLCQNKAFQRSMENNLIPATNRAIESFLTNQTEMLYTELLKISQYQYDNFQKMIPKEFQKIWQEGLNSNLYYLKLCGSGGGGYLLGMAKNRADINQMQKTYEVIWL